MGVDQPGHDPLAGGVDDLDIAAVVEGNLRRQRADVLDLIALDDDGVAPPRRAAGAVDQRSVANDDCSRSATAHQGLLTGAWPNSSLLI